MDASGLSDRLPPQSDLESARATLRRPEMSDFKLMRLLETEPLIMRFTPARVPQTERQTTERLSGQVEREAELAPYGIWIAEEKHGNGFIGWFMLMHAADAWLELGFMINKIYWNKGLATEICRVLVDFGLANPAIGGITAKTATDNFASMRVLEKLGLRFEKTMAIPEKVFGGEVDVNVFRRARSKDQG